MRKVRKSVIGFGILLTVTLVALAYSGWNRVVMVGGKDPGLGVRRLHAQGITGSGVSVAIIDGHLRTDHVEYRDQLAYYEELSNFEGIPYEFHGPMVTSILVGRQIGVAPGAKLYYFAQNFAAATPAETADALRHILTFTQDLPADQRIRAVSISHGWPDRPEGVAEFETAVDEAWQSGVVVLTSQYPTLTQPPLAIRDLGCPPWKDRDNPLNYGISPGGKAYLRDQNQSVAALLQNHAQSDRDKGYVTLYAPGDYSTLAGPGEGKQGYGPDDYFYSEEGGLSRATPYLSGVLALALQVNPALTPDEMVTLLADGVYELENGVRLIASEKVVQLARLK